MTALAAILAWAAAAAVLVPTLMLALEVAASFAPHRRRGEGAPAPSIAVIVPAHNEGEHIRATLSDLRAQLRAGDRLIVVADNCTDNTAAVARECGAEVFARNEPDRRGKGYALQFAIDRLRAPEQVEGPPGCVAFFDADCRLAPGTLERLARLAAETGRPAQALYLMYAREGAGAREAVAAFAWIVINRVRMTGLSNLFDVTRFTGLGMAAPWNVAAGLNLASADITEDLTLTFDMIRRGAAPLFVPEAEVRSVFPESDEAGVTQRARWEHGSLGVLSRHGGPAFVQGVLTGNFRLALFALDALIPPLAMLAGLIALALVLSAVLAPLAGPGPLLAAGLALGLYGLSLGAAWLRHGRKVLPLAKLPGIVPFLMQKLKIYGSEGRAASKTWTRTDRGGRGGKT